MLCYDSLESRVGGKVHGAPHLLNRGCASPCCAANEDDESGMENVTMVFRTSPAYDGIRDHCCINRLVGSTGPLSPSLKIEWSLRLHVALSQHLSYLVGTVAKNLLAIVDIILSFSRRTRRIDGHIPYSVSLASRGKSETDWVTTVDVAVLLEASVKDCTGTQWDSFSYCRL